MKNNTKANMATSCNKRIIGLWCNNQRNNAWVYLSPGGWRKLDDRNDESCTNLLAIAATAKSSGASVMIDEEFRNGRWHITEIYDFSHGGNPVSQEFSFSVSECIYGWTAAYEQTGTHIVIRIKLSPETGISDATMDGLKTRWKAGIESEWSYKFACCNSPGCTQQCAFTFEVQWVETNEHHEVEVLATSGRSNMTLWHANDSGRVAAHEFGHMLGHPDEYRDSTCPSRNPVNTGTVMDDNRGIIQRLVQPFCDNLGQDITSA